MTWTTNGSKERIPSHIPNSQSLQSMAISILLVLAILTLGSVSFLFALPLSGLVLGLGLVVLTGSTIAKKLERWVHGSTSILSLSQNPEQQDVKDIPPLSISCMPSSRRAYAMSQGRKVSPGRNAVAPRPVFLPPKTAMTSRALSMRRPHHAHTHSA